MTVCPGLDGVNVGHGTHGPQACFRVRFGRRSVTAPAPEEVDDLSIKRASRRTEESLIRRALAKTGGNRTRAAELLEISHRALLYKIKEYGVASPRGEENTPPPDPLKR